MNRSKNVLVSILAIAIISSVSVGIAESAEVPTAKFANCEKLLTKYKFGVAVSKSKKGSSKAIVSGTIYKANKKLDLDKNGVACNSGDLGGGASWPAVTYSGVGAFVQEIAVPAGRPAIVTLGHDGESNFAVSSLDGKLESMDLLANEIGAYSGTVFLGRGFSFESKDVKYLEIDADGTWSAKVAPASSAPSFTGVASGSGDVVLRYGGGKTIVSLTHDGTSNFAVTTYDNKGLYGDLVANEIGAYKGRVVLPAAEYIAIEADGNWTISK